MADQFDSKSVNERIQVKVGLIRYKKDGKRYGDKSATSEISSQHVGVKIVHKCMTVAQAKALLEFLNSDKSMPVGHQQLVNLEQAMAHLCTVANEILPRHMFANDVCPNQQHQFHQAVSDHKERGDTIGLKTYAVLGAPHFFDNVKATEKFIMFFWNNTDKGHRLKWNDLTGKEQEDWIKLFRSNGETHTRLPDADTNGFKGTNPGRVTDANLQDILTRTPRFKGEIERIGVFHDNDNPRSPYRISQDNFDNVVGQLNFDSDDE